MSSVIFMGACFLLDLIVEALFPSDPSMVGFIFVPSCALIGVLCLCKRENWLNSIYLAFITGLVSDFISMNSIGNHALIFILCSIILHLWSKHLSNSLFEQILLLISTVFVKELLIYLGLLADAGFRMSVTNWLLYRCMATLIGNLPLALIVVGMHEIKSDVDARQERNKRKEESLFWKKF